MHTKFGIKTGAGSSQSRRRLSTLANADQLLRFATTKSVVSSVEHRLQTVVSSLNSSFQRFEQQPGPRETHAEACTRTHGCHVTNSLKMQTAKHLQYTNPLQLPWQETFSEHTTWFQ